MRAGLGALAVAGSMLAAACTMQTGSVPREKIWRGTVVVRGVEEIGRGETLIIRPGTRVLFSFRDVDANGWGESGLLVRGRILALGTREEPVTFEPEDNDRRPGRWGEIRIESGEPSRFLHTRFHGGTWALHAHFTALQVESCRFRENFGAVKFRGDPVKLYGNVFSGNGTAIRYWESNPEIISNIIEENGTGIFCRQGSTATLVRGNNFLGNTDYHIKLGELQEHDLDARFNYWGTAEAREIESLLFDRQEAGYIGRVLYDPSEPGPFPLEGGRAVGNRPGRGSGETPAGTFPSRRE